MAIYQTFLTKYGSIWKAAMTKKLPKQRKRRSAQILFVKDTPFKNKIVRLRTIYTRKTKHKGKEQ